MDKKKIIIVLFIISIILLVVSVVINYGLNKIELPKHVTGGENNGNVQLIIEKNPETGGAG